MVWFAWRRREALDTRVKVRQGGEVAGQPHRGWQSSSGRALDVAFGRFICAATGTRSHSALVMGRFECSLVSSA